MYKTQTHFAFPKVIIIEEQPFEPFSYVCRMYDILCPTSRETLPVRFPRLNLFTSHCLRVLAEYLADFPAGCDTKVASTEQAEMTRWSYTFKGCKIETKNHVKCTIILSISLRQHLSARM